MSAAEERANILFAEVEKEVKANRSLRVSLNDTSRRVGRFLDTQKRFIALNLTTFVLTASIAVLGGPIAAAVALGAGIVGFGLSAAWERLSVWWSNGKYLKKKAAGLTVMKSGDLTIADGSTVTVTGVMNDDYSEVLGDVKTVLKGKGLTDVYNALANLDVDFQNLSKFISDPQISGDWERGSFGATRADQSGPVAPVRLTSCNDAVELWETLCRINLRYGQVAETHAMLDEFIMHMALATSRYDANERRDLRKAWAEIAAYKGNNAKDIFDHLNLRVNEEGVQKHAFRKLSRTKDYSAWIYSKIPDFIKSEWTPGFKLDMDLEVLRRNDEAAFKRVRATITQSVSRNAAAAGIAAKTATAISGRTPSNVSGQVVNVGREYLASIVSIPESASMEDIGGALKGASITTGSAFLTMWLNSMQSESWQYAHTAATRSDADSIASLSSSSDARNVMKGLGDPIMKFREMGPQIIMGIATSVVKVAIEAANSAWNERKLETGMTLGATGMRQQSFGERIGTLRTFAKSEIDAYVELLEEWDAAHKRLSGAGTQSLSGAFLTHVKCSQAYYSNRTGQLFEELVFVADEMKTRAKRSVQAAEEAIRATVANVDHSNCKGKKFCYRSLADSYERWLAKTPAGYLITDDSALRQLHARFDQVPSRMVAGDGFEIFRNRLLSTLPARARAELMAIDGD